MLVPKVCSAKPNGSWKGTHEFHGDILLRQSLIPDKSCRITRIYCSVNATVAQPTKLPFGVNTMTELQKITITSHNTDNADTLVSRNIPG